LTLKIKVQTYLVLTLHSMMRLEWIWLASVIITLIFDNVFYRQVILIF